jgi:Lrp/AsnC family leucine-responsive transcriptional regulator
MKIDAINVSILKILQQNARTSNAEIGRQVGISSPAVGERIKKMEDTGIIDKYQTVVSYQETGFQLKAIITMKAFVGKLVPFIKKVKSYKEVINCYRITGNDNIVMEVVFKNQTHMESFIDDLILYGETKTQIVLSKIIDNNAILPIL